MFWAQRTVWLGGFSERSLHPSEPSPPPARPQGLPSGQGSAFWLHPTLCPQQLWNESVTEGGGGGENQPLAPFCPSREARPGQVGLGENQGEHLQG